MVHETEMSSGENLHVRFEGENIAPKAGPKRGFGLGKKSLAVLGAVMFTSLWAVADEPDCISYQIKWGGQYPGEDACGFTDEPGCCIHFTDELDEFFGGGYGYADVTIDSYGVGLPYTIYRDDVAIATGVTEYGLNGSMWFTDYDVVPGRTYKYEIKVLGEDVNRIFGTNFCIAADSDRLEYTTGPTNVECYFIHTAEIKPTEVAFDEEGGDLDVGVKIYRKTASETIREDRPGYGLEADSDWIGVRDASQLDGQREFITISADANETGAAREGIVTVSYQGFEWQIKVKQSAADITPDPVTRTVTFNANGGGVSPATRTVEDGASVGELPAATWDGHTLDGWFTAADGGDAVTAATVVTADVTFYAHWTEVVVPPEPEPEPVITQQVWTVTFNVQGGVIAESSRGVTNDCAVGELPAATWDGHTLDGWFTAADGGSRVSSETVVTADVTFYARWTEVAVPPEPEPEPEPTPSPVTAYSLYEAVEGEVPTVASTYDGYLYDGDGNVKGSIQVKVGKPNANTKLASVKAVVIGLDGKKKNLKAAEKGKAPIAADGPTTVTFVGGDACEVTLGTCGMAGTYGDYFIDGALNVFMSKDAADKAVATAALGQWRGAVNVAWRNADAARPEAAPYQMLTVSIAAKGKAKVAGMLADGAKVSATSQLVVGEEWCCVPVAYAKKGVNLAFNVWLRRVGDAAPYQTVVGLGEDVKVGKPGTLRAGAAFCLGAVLGDAKYADYLPDGMTVAQSGTKWTLPKAGKVQLAKDGQVDKTKLGENPSALKLTYKAADGTFKGSFKAYADVNGKPKATTVNVTGVLVNGTGYGTAAVKKVAVAPVTIE